MVQLPLELIRKPSSPGFPCRSQMPAGTSAPLPVWVGLVFLPSYGTHLFPLWAPSQTSTEAECTHCCCKQSWDTLLPSATKVIYESDCEPSAPLTRPLSNLPVRCLLLTDEQWGCNGICVCCDVSWLWAARPSDESCFLCACVTLWWVCSVLSENAVLI